MHNDKEKALIFELSKPGRVGYNLPALDVPEVEGVNNPIRNDAAKPHPN